MAPIAHIPSNTPATTRRIASTGRTVAKSTAAPASEPAADMTKVRDYLLGLETPKVTAAVGHLRGEIATLANRLESGSLSLSHLGGIQGVLDDLRRALTRQEMLTELGK